MADTNPLPLPTFCFQLLAFPGPQGSPSHTHPASPPRVRLPSCKVTFPTQVEDVACVTGCGTSRQHTHARMRSEGRSVAHVTGGGGNEACRSNRYDFSVLGASIVQIKVK